MLLSFDAAKCERNDALRGLRFGEAEHFEWSTALIVEDVRGAYPEQRYQALGLLNQRLHMLVFTPRVGTVHMISLRKANRRERKLHEAPQPELIDDDAPEADADWFQRAKAASEVLPGLVGESAAAELLKPKVGRPRLEKPKEHLNIRLDADVVSAFRGMGAGWQTKMNNALRDWLNDKLDRLPGMSLSRMDDVAGCRLIFKSIDELYAFRESFHRARFNHKRRNADDKDKYDYIKRPKDTGYRGVHDVYEYDVNSIVGRPLAGLYVEIQYRTLVQHAWATAVEVIGFITESQPKFQSRYPLRRCTEDG